MALLPFFRLFFQVLLVLPSFLASLFFYPTLLLHLYFLSFSSFLSFPLSCLLFYSQHLSSRPSLHFLPILFIPSFPLFIISPFSFIPLFLPSCLASFILGITVRRLNVFSAHRCLQQQITLLLFQSFIHPFFLLSLSLLGLPTSLSLDGGRLGALAAQRGLQQQLHVKLASPHSLQCNSSLLRRGKVICL